MFPIDPRKLPAAGAAGVRRPAGRHRTGRRPAGERLPSVRKLAQACGISTMTATNAYQRLVAEGHVEARPASGYYVAALPVDRAQRRRPFQGRTSVDSLWLLKHVYEDDRALRNAGCGWIPPEWLYADGMRRAMAALARKAPTGLARYGTPYGYLPLRQQIRPCWASAASRPRRTRS